LPQFIAEHFGCETGKRNTIVHFQSTFIGGKAHLLNTRGKGFAFRRGVQNFERIRLGIFIADVQIARPVANVRVGGKIEWRDRQQWLERSGFTMAVAWEGTGGL
jgi:hypothetical protein